MGACFFDTDNNLPLHIVLYLEYVEIFTGPVKATPL